MKSHVKQSFTAERGSALVMALFVLCAPFLLTVRNGSPFWSACQAASVRLPAPGLATSTTAAAWPGAAIWRSLLARRDDM